MVRAKNTKDIPELMEKRKSHAENNQNKIKLDQYKQKLFSELTPADKDFLLQMLFIRAGFIKG